MEPDYGNFQVAEILRKPWQVEERRRVLKQLETEYERRISAAERDWLLRGCTPITYETTERFALSRGAGEAVVTIVTQCSMDRLMQLEQMTLRWSGGISAAVYVDNRHERDHAERIVKALGRRVAARGACTLDLSLLFATDHAGRAEYDT